MLLLRIYSDEGYAQDLVGQLYDYGSTLTLEDYYLKYWMILEEVT
jgi:hypothetical protein